MIEIQNLVKVYNKVPVLDIESLLIPQGESFGLVGNNGAGKTTLFSLITDLRRATKGIVLSKESNVASSGDWKSYTGSYIDENFLIDFLTPTEYFEFIGSLHGLSRETIDQFYKDYEEFFAGEINDKKKIIRKLSKGNQKKVGIAAALMTNPEVVILDEPFSNLDPTSQILLKRIIKNLRQTKKSTWLISSHDLNHVTEVCDRIVILEKGKIVHDLRTEEKTLKELETYFSVLEQ